MRFLLLTLFLLSSVITFSQQHWESIILSNDTFNYYVASEEPDASWKTLAFNTSLWPRDQGGFGYDDDDDGTIISATTSVYLRKTFNIADLSTITASLLYLDYDDGFVAYLNGKEIARSANLSDITPTYNSTVSANHEAGTPERFEVTLSDYIEGENVLAVQVINKSISSSDLSSNVFLHVEIDSPDTIYSATPNWFNAPVTLSTSNLPIIIINTNGAEIVDEPKIVAEMLISNNTDGTRNSIAGPFTEYNGKIAIELRGESTIGKAKKSYRLETQLENGDNNNVSIMGMPKENDWILYAPYMDKSLLRNDIAFHLCDVLGQYATRRQFCELVVNDEYLGIYVFEEKIKVDDNRVNIAKLKTEDIEGDELTGGYIFRSDKTDPGYSYFSSGIDYFGEETNKLQYYDPSQDDLTENQKDYLKDYITSFETSLVGSHFENPNTGYNNYTNVSSFIDYLLASEVTLEQDRYRFSTYFHKEKDSNGGKIYAGPIWDNNYGFGLSKSWDYTLNADVWQYEYESGRIYWWRRMMEDPYFENLFYTRWTTQRAQELSDSSLMHYVDSMASYLDEAQGRNFQRWPILGVYVFPNQFTGETYQEDVDYLKNWILGRCDWMDNNVTGEMIEASVSMKVENNYFDKDTFAIELELTSDYFNRKIFRNKHFKLNNEGALFSKDSIYFTDASTALMQVTSSLPGSRLPANFSVSVYDKVINSFTDLSTELYGVGLSSKSIISPKNDLTAYISNGEIVITCSQPDYLGSELQVYNMLGVKLANADLEHKYTNRIALNTRDLFLVLRLSYNGEPYSFKLVTK